MTTELMFAVSFDELIVLEEEAELLDISSSD